MDPATLDAAELGASLWPRRRLLGAAAALPLIAAAPVRAPELFPDGATMLVGGPDGGRLDRWAGTIGPALSRFLPSRTVLRAELAGGSDGVTAANQFDARTAPDGTTVLLVPGAAALAWLVGDPRARFDAAHWVPVLAATAPAAVIGRSDLSSLAPGMRLRVAAGGPVGPDLPVLLALELLGVEPVPVLGLAEPGAALDAFARNTVDCFAVRGAHLTRQIAMAGGAGGRALFSLGAVDDAGGLARDPAVPDLPQLAELLEGRPSQPGAARLYAAWRATAAACQMEFALVLPQLTPAAAVAVWRRAGAQAVSAPDVQAAAAIDGVRPQASPGATALATTVATEGDVMLQLRQWLGMRFNWRPT